MYMVRMDRYGKPENHNYVIGLFSDQETAKYAGLIEEYWRGGKYRAKCVFLSNNVDVIDNEKEEWYLENVVGKENEH